MAVTQPEQDDHTQCLEKYSLQKTLRVGACVKKSIYNCKNKPANRKQGPLQYQEYLQEEMWWVAKVQKTATAEQLEKAAELNLQKNESGLLECHGRIVGQYPLYLPETSPFSEKLVERNTSWWNISHNDKSSTALLDTKTTQPREKGPKELLGMQKKPGQTISSSSTWPSSHQPNDRRHTLFRHRGRLCWSHTLLVEQEARRKSILGTLRVQSYKRSHLELLKCLETAEFLQSFKHFIALRGRPALVYSDNGTTFKATATWLKKVRNDEKFHATLCSQEIQWRFNLAKAPWWGGQFERLIGIFKFCFRKAVGGAFLTFSELKEIVLDVETCTNNRPFTYLEDDPQLPILTLNSFLFQRHQILPELQPQQVEEHDLRKRLRFLRATKDALWLRWTREYLTGLRERHKASRGTESTYPTEGDIVSIKGEDKNRNACMEARESRKNHQEQRWRGTRSSSSNGKGKTRATHTANVPSVTAMQRATTTRTAERPGERVQTQKKSCRECTSLEQGT